MVIQCMGNGRQVRWDLRNRKELHLFGSRALYYHQGTPLDRSISTKRFDYSGCVVYSL